MIMMLIVTIFAALGVLAFTFEAIVSAIVNTIFNGYIFVCIKSLHDMIRDEEDRGMNRQYIAPGGKV